MGAPLIVMLAGPNGAGKSTFHSTFLAELDLPFLNADILGRELALDAYTAADSIASIRDELIQRRESFVTETVLSDPVGEKVVVLKAAAKAGFDVTLIYVGIKNAALSERRVRARVQAGGHDVPKRKLLARYNRSLENLDRAIRQLPRVVVYDNSSFKSSFRFLAEFEDGEITVRGSGRVPAWAKRFLS